MSVGANYRKILSYETLLSTKLQKDFKKQEQYLMEHLDYLLQNPYKVNMSLYKIQQEGRNLYKKEYNSDPLEEFWNEMGVKKTIEDVQKVNEKVGEKGAKKWYTKFKELIIAEGFGEALEELKNYNKLFGETNLSNFKGSITRTTKEAVLTAVKDGIDQQLTNQELAKNIQKINKEIFSPNRAKLIAVTELGKAYEYGAYTMVKKLKDKGYNMMKKWETCHDSKVRPAHYAAESEGWVEFDYCYSHGYTTAGSEPRCRCTMLYERKDMLDLTDL